MKFRVTILAALAAALLATPAAAGAAVHSVRPAIIGMAHGQLCSTSGSNHYCARILNDVQGPGVPFIQGNDTPGDAETLTTVASGGTYEGRQQYKIPLSGTHGCLVADQDQHTVETGGCTGTNGVFWTQVQGSSGTKLINVYQSKQAGVDVYLSQDNVFQDTFECAQLGAFGQYQQYGVKPS